jgi:cytochrome c-type biogenesis protein CcmH/NrfG
MSDDFHPSPEAAFQRGRLLQSQHRLQDAIACYQQALSLDAQHVESYLMLSLCWMEADETTSKSVDAARRGVALEPENSFARSVLALALNAAAKDGQTALFKAALEEAVQGIRFDPDSDLAHAVAARLHLRLREYPQAEQAARKALELDTENTMAAEVLSAALLLQNKAEDNEHLINYQLQRDPEDDAAHTSAGWQAVMKGDHKKANEHFMEALRLNPMNEGARSGLIEAYRARSWFYNAFLRYCNWMNQFTEGKQNAIMIGGFIGYKLLSGYLKTVAPFWAYVVIGLWLVFALWSHLARGLSTFFVAMDRFARQALKPREFWEGAIVGWLIFFCLGALILGYVYDVKDYAYAALCFLFAAVANAAAFTNDHYIGKHVYNVAAALAGFGALYFNVHCFTSIDLPATALAASVAIFTGIIISWLRPFRVLYD